MFNAGRPAVVPLSCPSAIFAPSALAPRCRYSVLSATWVPIAGCCPRGPARYTARSPTYHPGLCLRGVRFGGRTDPLGLMRDRRPLSIRVRLVLASTLMLFLELSLIRWSGAQVVHLSYFSNFILLGSFLGIGLGFLRANRSKRRQPFYSIVALLAYVGFLSRFPVAVNRDQESVIYFTSLSTSGPPIWVTLPVIFLAVAAIMAGPGELVADCF